MSLARQRACFAVMVSVGVLMLADQEAGTTATLVPATVAVPLVSVLLLPPEVIVATRLKLASTAKLTDTTPDLTVAATTMMRLGLAFQRAALTARLPLAAPLPKEKSGTTAPGLAWSMLYCAKKSCRSAAAEVWE